MRRRILGSFIAVIASGLLFAGVASSSGVISRSATIAGIAGAASPPFWERLDKDIAGDNAQVPAPNANTSCPDRPNMLATADTLLTLAERRDNDLQMLREKLDAIYAKAEAAGLSSLAKSARLTIMAAFQPLISLIGRSPAVENLGPESDTLSELRLDLSLASRSTASNQTLIERLHHAQTQLESTSAHCD